MTFVDFALSKVDRAAIDGQHGGRSLVPPEWSLEWDTP